METCPFCGKAFKRLKSHLPHCKVAAAQGDSSATEQTKKSPKTGTQRTLLEAKAKEQNLKNKGDDNMEITKKTKPSKKKPKHLESPSCKTQKTMFEEKEMVTLNTPIHQSHLDQAHGNSHLIDKEGDMSGDRLIVDPTAMAILESPEASISLVETGAVHVAVTQPHTAALQVLAESSESLKASKDILPWPSHKEEFRGTVEKMESAGIKLPIYEEVSKVIKDGTEEENRFGNVFQGSYNGKDSQKHENQYLELPSEPNSSFLMPTMVSSSYRPESQFPRHNEHAQLPDISHQLQTWDSEELKSTKKSLEGQGKTWDSSALKSRTKSLEGQMQTWDSEELKSMNKSLGGQVQTWDSEELRSMNKSLGGQVQTWDSNALKSTKKSLEGQLQIWDSNALKNTKKSLEGQLQTWDLNASKSTKKALECQLNLNPAKETETFLPVRDVLSRNFSLGLQWIPELHSNYIVLKVVPGKIDLMSSDWKTGKSIAPGLADSEFCKPTQPQLIPEVPLTSRRLMDVRIGELYSWLALQRFSMKSVPEIGLRAWNRYYNKYINVKKGGIGGLTMIIAGYCTLSYVWNYHHIRQDRWRKYH